MGNINWGRVLLGGFVAGIIINLSEFVLNVPVLGEAWADSMEAFGKPREFGGGQLALFNLMGFVLGLSLVWLYAAIRPRYGAGAKTALCASLAMWCFAALYPWIGQVAMDLFPFGAMLTALVWMLVEFVVAGWVGCRLYQEA